MKNNEGLQKQLGEEFGEWFLKEDRNTIIILLLLYINRESKGDLCRFMKQEKIKQELTKED